MQSSNLEVFSEAESLQLSLQPPEILNVLVNVTGVPLNASEAGADIMFLNATASVNEEHDVEVTLEPYAPYLFEELVLHLSVLLPDRDFVSDWSLTAAETSTSQTLQFRQCASSEFLSERFEVCRKAENRTGGWASSVVQVAMSAWAPEETHLTFGVIPKKQKIHRHASTRSKHAVRVMLKGDPPSVGAWAVSPALRGSERCRFLAEVGDLHAAVHSGAQEGFLTAPIAKNKDATRAQRYAMSRAACAYVRRDCPAVHTLAFGSVNLTNIVPEIFEHAAQQSQLEVPVGSDMEQVLQLAIKKASPALWSFARCLAEAARLPQLADVCKTTCEGRLPRLIDIPGLICCKFPLDSLLTADGLVAILHTTPDDTDDSLVKGYCDVLRKNASEAKEQEFAEVLIAAAISMQNLQAVNLTLRHCVRKLTSKQGRLLWTAREIPLNLTGLIWDDFPQHLSDLLQAALDNRCTECLASWDSSLPGLGTADVPHSKNVSLRFVHQQREHRLLSEIAGKPGIVHLIVDLHVGFGAFSSSSPATAQFVQALCQLLRSSRRSLASLEIVELSFEDARSADEFAASLRQLSKLQSLTLRHVEMAGLAQLLPTEANALPELQALRVSSNLRKDPLALGPFLASRAGLRSLELENMKFHPTKADQFVTALRQLRQLESLKLASCDMPFTAASQLLANISNTCPSLQALQLRLTPSSDAAASQGIATLTQALVALSPCPLQHLSMPYCSVADEDLLRLFDALGHCRNLTKLDCCRGNCGAMSKSSIAALQKRMPYWPKAEVRVPVAAFRLTICKRLHSAAADSDGQSSHAMP